MIKLKNLNRRTVLGLGAGTVAATLFSPAVLRAQSASGDVVVSTWGGDYANLLTKNIETPLLQPKGITAVQDLGDEPIRMAKLIAQKQLPAGNTDIISVQAPADFELHQAGLLETLDEGKIPNLKYVQQSLSSAFAIPHICSPQVIAYSPERVKTPPKSFADLEDPQFAGKIGLLDASELWIAMAAALKHENDPTKILEMKPVLEKMIKSGAKTFSSTEAFAPAMKSGEIDVGLVWHARVLSWSQGGIPMASAFPAEGCMTYVVNLCVLKNAPNKAAAFEYLNAALDPAAQRGFARDMGYNPTITNAELEGDVAKRLALPEPAPKLFPAPSEQLSKVQNEMSDWWRRLLQRA